MYCRNCGKEINDNADVCLHCGVSTNKATANQSSAQQSNVFAYVGFIFSFPIPLVGLILSIIGRTKAASYNDDGKGLSLAGIIISSIILAFTFIFLIVFFYLYFVMIMTMPFI